MAQSLISASYNEAVTVSFTQDAWFNATVVAASFSKRLDHWLENQETQAYIAALSEILNTRNSGDLIRAMRGRNGGTWLHPKLAIPFARWLDVRFAVWCDLQIESILKARAPYGLKDLGTRKALPGCLTCEQQDAIKAMIRSKAETLPDPKAQAKWSIGAWSAVGAKFGVKGMKDGYKNIPAEHFPEVLSLVARLELPMEGEHIPAGEGPLTGATAIFNGNLLVEVKDGRIAWARAIGPDEYLMTEASFREMMEREGKFLVDTKREEDITRFIDRHVSAELLPYAAIHCIARLGKLSRKAQSLPA